MKSLKKNVNKMLDLNLKRVILNTTWIAEHQCFI
jgi:hypothetical protein